MLKSPGFNQMPKFQFVDLDSNDAVSALLATDRRIGLDTEFMREKTFYPRLCLMQIATDDGIYCADPMSGANLELFWQRLMECPWVVHSARQDIEVLYHSSNLMPDTLFDTQIAAALLGYAPQLGYAGLVKELFGVELAKSHTRADWTKRPLPAAALDYAAEDVAYLLPAYEILSERLSKLDRLHWAEEDSAFLLQPSLYKGHFGQTVERLKGARNLRGRARAAAAKLASWREGEAVRTDRPRQWIMKDAVLLEIAATRPKDLESLAEISGLAPRTLRRAGKALLDILTEEQLHLFEKHHDLDFAYEIPEVGRFRVNFLRQRHGIGAVFRIIPSRIPALEDLGLPQVVLDLAGLEQGLVLVTGPTGSGKSTTLAAIIDHINRETDKHIITIEDPMEFVHVSKQCLVTQREVGSHTLSFAAALRAVLREDPDIILIGEMRDLETIALAITAAETGHLVFGTLHTRSAASTVDRVIDVFPPEQQGQIRTMLAETLKGVVSQQLLVQADDQGRVAAAEVLIGTTALSNLIREGKTYQISSIIQTGRREGMQTMDQAILELLRAKRITPQEAYRKAVDKDTYRQYLERL